LIVHTEGRRDSCSRVIDRLTTDGVGKKLAPVLKAERLGCGLNEQRVVRSNESLSLNSDGRFRGRRTDRLDPRCGAQQRCCACRRSNCSCTV